MGFFSRDNQEFIDNLVAVAVPVEDPNGRLFAALAFHGPTQRISIEEAEAHDREAVRLRLAEVFQELETEIRHRDDAMVKGADTKEVLERFDLLMGLVSEEVAAEYDPFAATMPLVLREAFQSRELQHQLKEVKVALQAVREHVESINDLEEDLDLSDLPQLDDG